MSAVYNVARLKASLSEALALVKEGHEVVVTQRGKPFAVIRGLEQQGSGRVRELVRTGVLHPPRQRLDVNRLARMRRPKCPRGAGLRALLAEREEGR